MSTTHLLTISRRHRLDAHPSRVTFEVANLFSNNLKKILVLLLNGILVLTTIPDLPAQDVKYNFMPGTAFSKYHSYKWVDIQGGAHPNQIVDAEIKECLDSQLASKGLTKVDSDKADLYVGYQVAVNQEKQWNAYGTGGGWRMGGGMGTATLSTINVGSLVFDMYDPLTKQLVWTGIATKTLNPSSNQQKNQERLNKGMAKLLKNYPPPNQQ